MGGEQATFIAVDPSTGGRGRHGDYSAIVVVALHTGLGRVHVVAADIERLKPDEMIARIVEYAQLYGPEWISVESNGFQALLLDQLSAGLRGRGLSCPVDPVTNTARKLARISGLQPHIQTGRVRFSRKHTRLLEQLRQFPLGAHDDGPDALEMAVRVAQAPVSNEIGVFHP